MISNNLIFILLKIDFTINIDIDAYLTKNTIIYACFN